MSIRVAESLPGRRAARALKGVFFFLTFALLVGAGVAAYRNISNTRSVLVRTSGELEAVRADLLRLEHVVGRQALSAPPAPAPPASTPPVTSGPGVVPPVARQPETPDERDHRLRVYNEARLELSSAAFSREPSDTEWAGGAEQTIREAYATDEYRSLQLSAECRSTFCRIEFSYSDPDAGFDAARNLFASPPPWPGKRFYHVDPKRKEGVCYLARQDLDLPRVDAASLRY